MYLQSQECAVSNPKNAHPNMLRTHTLSRTASSSDVCWRVSAIEALGRALHQQAARGIERWHPPAMTLSEATPRATAHRTLFVTSLVGFMVALEITVIALARDEIARAFPGASAATLSWVITAYNIGVASVLLPAGRLADRFGTRPLLVTGGLFGVAATSLHLVWTGTEASYVTGMLIPGLVIGLCAACGFAPLVGAAMRDVPPPRYAMAGAGRNTVFQLSIALGVAAAIGIVGPVKRSSSWAIAGGAQRRGSTTRAHSRDRRSRGRELAVGA